MKTINLFLVSLVSLVAMVALLSGCSKNDPINGKYKPGNYSAKDLIGTWYIDTNNDPNRKWVLNFETSGIDSHICMVFDSNGTMGDSNLSTMNSTWKVKGNQLTIIDDNKNTFILTILIKGDTLKTHQSFYNGHILDIVDMTYDFIVENNMFSTWIKYND